jgi:hypothetical protein
MAEGELYEGAIVIAARMRKRQAVAKDAPNLRYMPKEI